MNILLDTCAILYTELQPEKLSDKARHILQKSDTQVFVSAISVAEIACGWGKRFKLKKHWRPWLRETLETNGWDIVPIDFDIIEEAYSLPDPFHRDPADRILVATSRLKNISLVTNDHLITEYPFVRVYW